MNTKLFVLALASAVGLSTLSAQEAPAHKTVFAKDKASHHWFIEVGDYATISLGGDNAKASFGDRVSFLNPTLSLGRWHSPYFATRLSLMGGKLYDHIDISATPGVNNLLRTENSYGMARVDFMFDVVNYFAPYREDRFFHFIPFVGIGGAYQHKTEADGLGEVKRGKAAPVVNAGVQLKFRLARRVDLNLEALALGSNLRLASNGAEIAPTAANKVPSYVQDAKGTFVLGLGANLTFHLGKKEFTPIVPEDEALLRGLNDELNRLRAENAELSKRPVSCPDPVVVPAKSIAVGNVVYFRLDSDKVDANQMINIHNIAEYAKGNTETITLVGYADRQTGTPEYNYNLSERRAAAVKKILVEKYGISADRIRTSWEGDRVQPYAENVWNRVVIMNAE